MRNIYVQDRRPPTSTGGHGEKTRSLPPRPAMGPTATCLFVVALFAGALVGYTADRFVRRVMSSLRVTGLLEGNARLTQ